MVCDINHHFINSYVSPFISRWKIYVSDVEVYCFYARRDWLFLLFVLLRYSLFYRERQSTARGRKYKLSSQQISLFHCTTGSSSLALAYLFFRVSLPVGELRGKLYVMRENVEEFDLALKELTIKKFQRFFSNS